MIRVRDLNVSYGTDMALRDVSFDVNKGECLVITGSSGCGKSTLARVLTGVIPNSIRAQVKGSVIVGGTAILGSSVADIARQVGVVFQNPRSHLFHLRVDDEVAFGPRNLGLSEMEVSARVEWALDAVGMNGLRGQRPAALSGGQIQRLAIAAALAMYPRVLVLDEPTASLDVPGTQSVVGTLEVLKRQFGLTIILIEHRLAEVQRLADRSIVMEQGRIAAQGTFDNVLGSHGILRRFGLRKPTAEGLTDWSQLLMPNGHHPQDQQPVLDLQNVTAGYDGEPVIHNIDMKIYPRDFVALVGNNGSGKSTLALTAAGLLKPVEGKVIVKGTARPRPGLDVALLFQNPADQLFTDSVEEEVAFGPRNYHRFDEETVNGILAKADLQHLRGRRPFTLSVGQQQRTALASCIALDPALVILDEPTLGQDWRHLQQLMDSLEQLNEQGTSILMITHDYKLVHHYARGVVLMEGGRLMLDGKIAPVSKYSISTPGLIHVAS